MADVSAALSMFGRAYAYTSRPEFRAEIAWQRSLDINSFTETKLLREAAWVILCSGFRERRVRQIFDHISLCFCDWESAESIISADPACRIAAMASFRNWPKLTALVKVAQRVESVGFDVLRAKIILDPITELQRLPYIGPITVKHLAKNLGLNVSKPDRHLERISVGLGFENTEHFCGEVARITGERMSVVDLIVWRYAADNPTILRMLPDPATTAQPLN